MNYDDDTIVVQDAEAAAQIQPENRSSELRGDAPNDYPVVISNTPTVMAPPQRRGASLEVRPSIESQGLPMVSLADRPSELPRDTPSLQRPPYSPSWPSASPSPFSNASAPAPGRGIDFPSSFPNSSTGRQNTQYLETPPPGCSYPTAIDLTSDLRPRTIRLNEADNLLLAQICASHRLEFTNLTRGQFWMNMAALFTLKTGKPLKDARAAMFKLIGSRRAQLRAWKNESGRVQEETDMSQAVDQFIEHLEQVDEEKENRRKNQDELRKEEADLRIQEENLLSTMGGRKRAITPDDSDDPLDLEFSQDNPDEDLLRVESRSSSSNRGRSTSRTKRKSHRNGRTDSSIQDMTSAVYAVAQAIGQSQTVENPLEERLDRVELAQQAMLNDTRETKETLNKILSLVEEMRAQSGQTVGNPREIP